MSFLSIRLLPNKYSALHGLRAIGIFLVVNYHVTPSYFPEIINLWFVMDQLFVLSGFLIGLILLSDLKREQGLLRFYLRRMKIILVVGAKYQNGMRFVLFKRASSCACHISKFRII